MQRKSNSKRKDEPWIRFVKESMTKGIETTFSMLSSLSKKNPFSLPFKIACFNFTNLTTAKSLIRAKEFELRKVAGADKKQLLSQFLSETVVLAFVALVIAIATGYLILPLFNQLSGRELNLDFTSNYDLLLLLLRLIVGVGLLAGLYPAVVLSAFKPVEVLKGKFIKSSKGVSFRKILVTLQFVVSIALIASTILVSKQYHEYAEQQSGYRYFCYL